ncbi:response regulator receiver modulated metal dependent phosphohydrolase [Paramagnetospirillum caucaseum]|uniref:Response regulator receiver modulated metal dependent phosphohydrolase n=1 Tax=Paramagnetospirillum caucaseum TaxID=1244869 RepID=M3A6U7_9PROT|nr:HD domain-containing phosphohydrolase [Paramagnetospirillum caucaseum]EME68528.1 response regulator receiver modulated metal dependent phosphohydrolase [Paramagnetospirillum caucaseum]
MAGHPGAAAILRHHDVPVVEAASVQDAMRHLWSDPAISVVASVMNLPGGGGQRLIDTARIALGRDLNMMIVSPLKSGSDVALPILARLSREAARGADAETANEVDKLFECLAVAAEHKDNETGRHNRRIGRYAGTLAAAMGWRPSHCRTIELAASLHDIGKIGIPDTILFKSSPLTPEERIRMEHHTVAGHQILSAASSPVLDCAANIALHHHERWSGGGYPFGLRGTAIPIEARIVALCDVYDALRSARPYKAGFSHQTAVAALLTGDDRTSSDHFDPAALEAFRHVQSGFDDIFSLMAEN